MKTNGIRLYSTKNGWTFLWFSCSFTVGVKKYSFWCPLKWLFFFFSYCIKKMIFLSSPKGTPTTGAVEQWEKPTLQWKPMELGGVLQKKGWIVFKKMSFSSSPKVTPTTGVAEQWTKNCFAMETNGIRWRSSKMDEPSPGFHGFHGQCQKI